ncbi:MAG: cytochrome oxidase putative small subunit CydP [Pseudomonadota bacterium]
MTRHHLSPLGREIALLLLVKLCLIITIKLVFFSDPVKPGSEGTAANLLATPSPEHTHHE